MPMEYLRELRRDELPLIESDVVNIDKLRILHAAGMVEVQLPPVDSPQLKALVLYITGLGCATLRASGSLVRMQHREQHCDLEASYD